MKSILWLAAALCFASVAYAARPNVLLVMMDDMGYGDLSCHGSPFIKTPHLDALRETGVRLGDFHVAPMCSPTRGQLLSGLDALRNGSSVIASSRMMVREEVPLAPGIFRADGYSTALFGKWHLGENPPHRPEDRGFEEAIWFPMQEIGSLSDHWCNDYFDPVLRGMKGKSRKYEGYCTDVFVEEATRWMRRQQEAKRPFFCYLPLNVCHGPQWAPKELREKIARDFPKLEPGHIGYLAMLANADENFGRLETFLRETGLRQNTIVVFLSDNGGYALIGRYNAGMRGGKSRLTEGGHRVPCFIRWPEGGISGGREIAGLTQVQDLLPTLLELSGVSAPVGARFDGLSLASALRGRDKVPERTLVVQYGEPRPFHMACVMRGKWRLLTDIKGVTQGGPELYNLESDPGQKTNLVVALPDVAADMRAAYDRWWQGVKPFTHKRSFIRLGDAQAEVTLNSGEWRQGAMHGIEGLRNGVKRINAWDVSIARKGSYSFGLRRWPASSGLAIRAGAPAWTPRDTATPAHRGYAAAPGLDIAKACLRIGGRTYTREVTESDKIALMRCELEPGQEQLEGWFEDQNGERVCPAFFVEVSLVE